MGSDITTDVDMCYPTLLGLVQQGLPVPQYVETKFVVLPSTSSFFKQTSSNICGENNTVDHCGDFSGPFPMSIVRT